jgi:hypothetical protein
LCLLPLQCSSSGATQRGRYRDRNLLPDLAALQRNVDLTRDLGLIETSLEAARRPMTANNTV